MSKQLRSIAVFLFLTANPVFAQPTAPMEEKTLAQWIAEAELWILRQEVPGYLVEVEKALDKIEQLDPKLSYTHWSRARVAFWKKEAYYPLETKETKGQYDKEKLDLANQCHRHSDRCLALAPENAECHMMKGVCYSMQASTWGQGWKTLSVLIPMDKEWVMASELPSSFTHMGGEVTTKQLSVILRGILYRVMPDSFWLRFFAGIRGNKEKAYQWIKESISSRLLKEPVLLLEFAAAAICYGRSESKPERISEGYAILRDGMKIPTRYPLDDFDKLKMAVLLERPEKACSYRRERFEEVTQRSLQIELRSQP